MELEVIRTAGEARFILTAGDLGQCHGSSSSPRLACGRYYRPNDTRPATMTLTDVQLPEPLGPTG